MQLYTGGGQLKQLDYWPSNKNENAPAFKNLLRCAFHSPFTQVMSIRNVTWHCDIIQPAYPHIPCQESANMDTLTDGTDSITLTADLTQEAISWASTWGTLRPFPVWCLQAWESWLTEGRYRTYYLPATRSIIIVFYFFLFKSNFSVIVLASHEAKIVTRLKPFFSFSSAFSRLGS